MNKYEKNTMTGKLHLCQRFFTMKMPEGSNAEKHMREMKDISDRLTALGSPLGEDYEIMVLLLSLPTYYSLLVTSLGVNTDKLKLEEVHSAILDLELRLQGQVYAVGNNAALVAAAGRTDNSKSTYCCYSCNNFVHIARDCPKSSESNAGHTSNHSNSRPRVGDSVDDTPTKIVTLNTGLK